MGNSYNAGDEGLVHVDRCARAIGCGQHYLVRHRYGSAYVSCGPDERVANLAEPQATQYHAFATSPRSMRNMRDEHSVYRDVFTQARTLTSLDGKPLVVITATESLDKKTGWADAQTELAALSSSSEHRIVDATHGGMLDDPDTFGWSVLAIGDVVQSIRADAQVETP